jgi:Domain of unknown function (DUF4410)
MKPLSRAMSCLLAFFMMAGCASTEVAEQQHYEGEKLARPDRIIVHDFTANPAEVPPESAFAAELAGTPPPTEQLEVGRRLGARVAKELVAELRRMRLPAVPAAGGPPPRPDDIVLRGYFVSVHEGRAGRCVLVGFGAGAAELTTAVEAYQVTAEGLRPLGRGEIRSEGGKLPGMDLPVAVVAATANPIGLGAGGTAQATGEATGSETIEGAGERTAKELAAQLRTAAQQQGWI